MKPATRAWLVLSARDVESTEILFRSRRPSQSSSICFHAQQAIEKALKGRLTEAGIPFPKRHDTVELLELLEPVEPLFEGFRIALGALAAYAVDVRYEEDMPTREQVRYAMKVMREVCRLVRERLGE
ncbi:MAG: HEPN domain-containing protein [bacterium]